MVDQVSGRGGVITRRSALKAGVAVSSGLAFGGLAIGTARADESETETENIIPVHHFVRDMNDSDPGSPMPDPGDKLVERRQGHPVDDGTQLGLDGTQLTWGEFSALEGEAKVKCDEDDPWTEVELEVEGLVPNGLYTAWVVVFKDPGFNDTRNLGGPGQAGTAFEHLIGVGSLGQIDGSENVFRADDEGEGEIEANHPGGDLSVFGHVGDCLLDEFEVHFVGVLHLDDQSWGPIPEPQGRGSLAEQFAFIANEGELV